MFNQTHGSLILEVPLQVFDFGGASPGPDKDGALTGFTLFSLREFISLGSKNRVKKDRF